MAATSPIAPAPATPSARPGMGTILYPGGVAFRVWAPFASQVFAAGDFNQWSPTSHPFAGEEDGYWYGENFTMPAWNDLVIYEIHVGSFNDSNPGGPGTFSSVIEKLPYLQDLG